jgi:hypothetical protein
MSKAAIACAAAGSLLATILRSSRDAGQMRLQRAAELRYLINDIGRGRLLE